MSSRISLLVAAASFRVLAACGGHVASVEDAPSEIVDGTRPAPTAQPAPPPEPERPVHCGAVPTCDLGDEEVASSSDCLQDDARCYSRTLCGATIWCTAPASNCDAVPVCQPGYVEVKTCPADAPCSPVTVCGSTILCLRSECPALPSCEPGDTKVPGPASCLQDDAACYARSACGMTIWCTGARP
jgi:hypothetical protein